MKHFDVGSISIIITTFILFVLALFFTGFTHDLLLESGIFLVSVKLIMMAYKNSVSAREIKAELKEIKELIQQKNEINKIHNK